MIKFTLPHLLRISTIGLTLLTSLASGATQIPPILDPHALQDGSDGHTPMDACQDFYHFSCGRWLDQTEIPSDKNAVSRQSTALLDQTDEKLNEILLNYSQGDQTLKASASRQLGDYYFTCMNIATHPEAAETLLKSKISEIKAIKNRKELAQMTARLHLQGVSAFFSFGSGQDYNDSTRVIGSLEQAGMSLPEPNFYSNLDSKSLDIREKFEDHIYKSFTLLGITPEKSVRKTEKVFKFETLLASKAYSLEDRRDPSKTNHPFTVETLKKRIPQFDWDAYFTEILPKTVVLETINVREPEFLENIGHLLEKTPLADLKTYLIWQLTKRSAPFLTPEFQQESFRFWNGILRGEKEMKPQWKRCTQAVSGNLGYALAEAYVSTIEMEPTRSKIQEMILLIKNRFQNNLNELTTGTKGNDSAWMDAQTKDAALQKLALLGQKIGAPEHWEDYSELKTDRTSYLANDFKVSEFESRNHLELIGQPVDTNIWEMMPWEVNAYYEGSKNEFVFPFGILQPPSFDIRAPSAVNLATFGGGTIGHELIHGYDNVGSQFDGQGNTKNWWTEATQKNFQERSQCFIEQANSFFIQEVGLNVNGKMTLSENLADQGGVKLGYQALLYTQNQEPKPSPAPLWLGKYNENQQFWIAYAQSWCIKRTPESLRNQIKTNEHPPEEFRVNGIVMNRPEFARDFGCQANAPMAPVKRCSLW